MGSPAAQHAPAAPAVPALAVPARPGRVRRYLAEHPALVDWIVVASALFLSVPLFVEYALHRFWWFGALLILQQLLLVFRRRAPWAVLAAAVAIEAALLFSSPHSSITSVSVLFALYALATAVPAAAAIPGVLAAALPAWIYYAFVYRPDGEYVPDNGRYVGLVAAASVALMYVLAAGLGMWVRGNRLHQADVRAWALRRAELASVQERNRIAREMHDVVAHSLTVMVALSDGAATVVAKDPERAQEVLGELSRTGRAALADMRRVLGVLREDAGGASRAPSPGTGSLQSLVAGFRTAGLPAVLTLLGGPLPEDASFQLAVYRIVQESLTNALRYGRGVGRADVVVAREDGRVRIHVEHDGTVPPEGARPQLGTGRGIAGMRERAAIYGGTLSAGPRPGGGWAVEATLLWAEPNGD
ncbi:sensor histidine kinase [Sinomonas mesophila]|uniref:sensor histidine kinase n=1 Tax=Sinomonas mesophila TaxID=1531955 RepID=UPI000984B630|nr:histidine kinase [Sinomonas mesophila]